MTRQFTTVGLLTALCLLVAGCDDTRRDAVRDYLQTHPPAGYELAEMPEKIPVGKTAAGGNESVLMVKYRLKNPTVEIRDALAQPRALEIARRIAALRDWALAHVPAGHPIQKEIAAASTSVSTPISVKRIVTPAGTQVETLAVLTLRKEANGWLVTPESLDVHTSGSADHDPFIPLEDSPDVSAKLDELEALAKRLEESRAQYLAEQKLAAERSLADLRALLKTGNSFTGRLADRTPVRLVISRGLESDEPAVVVLTIQRDELSTARCTGGLVQQPSGEYLWRTSRITPLSGWEPIMDSRLHPVFTLSAKGQRLVAGIARESEKPVFIEFQTSGKVDLIPEASAQDNAKQ